MKKSFTLCRDLRVKVDLILVSPLFIHIKVNVVVSSSKIGAITFFFEELQGAQKQNIF